MKLIFKYMRYVFYRAYLWQKDKQLTEGFAANVALAYVAYLLLFFSLVFLLAIEDIFRVAIFPHDKHAKVLLAVIFACVFYYLPYVIFVRAGRYKKIIAEFSKLTETKVQSRVREILIFLNFVSLFVLAVVLAVLSQGVPK